MQMLHRNNLWHFDAMLLHVVFYKFCFWFIRQLPRVIAPERQLERQDEVDMTRQIIPDCVHWLDPISTANSKLGISPQAVNM